MVCSGRTAAAGRRASASRCPGRGVVVGGGDEPEQRLGSGVVERGEPDLVHDDRVSTQEVLDDAADGVVGQAPVERLDQVAAAK